MGPKHNADDNRLLARLPAKDRTRLAKNLQLVTMHFKEPLYDSGRPVPYVYFVTSGIISLVIDLDDNETVETGTVGREGMAGLSAFFNGSDSSARAFCQIPGTALRMRASVFRREVARNAALRVLLMRYTYAVLSTLARGAACNRAHSLEERMSKWLLMTHDRVDSDNFPLTQQFLSQMLGVRRPTVSLAGGALQRAGLIRYTRGRVTIIDRAGLEEASCECYGYTRDAFEGL